MKISTFALAESPGVSVSVSLVQRIKFLVSFFAGESQFICEFEEVGSNIDEPFGVNGAHFSHVLFGCED